MTEARQALELGDVRRLGELMTENHGLLGRLGVSTERVDRMCTYALEAGALGAKITGSGGGGCVVALAASSEERARVRARLGEDGSPTWSVEVS